MGGRVANGISEIAGKWVSGVENSGNARRNACQRGDGACFHGACFSLALDGHHATLLQKRSFRGDRFS